jgi:hypothetical protein
MPNCSAYERRALSALPQYRVALQDSRSISRLLATASLVQRVALPEEHNTIGSFLGLVLHSIVEHCETLSCYRDALPKAHHTRWMSFAYPWCSQDLTS